LSFDWESTKQGIKYWLSIFNKAKNGDFSKSTPTDTSELKRETLENAAIKNCQYYADSLRHLDGIFIDTFKNGAKWQLEQMKLKQTVPIEKSKLTAVEWFWDKIKSHFEHDGDLFETATFTFSIAKEKERECIQDAYQQGYNNAYFNNPISKEDYYSQKFGYDNVSAKN